MSAPAEFGVRADDGMGNVSVPATREFSRDLDRIRGLGRLSIERGHIFLTVLLTLAVVPLLKVNRLPVRFAWAELSETYWMTFAFQGTFAAILLYLVGFSPRETLEPILARLRADKRRILILIPFLFVLYVLCVQLASAIVWPFLAIFSFAVLEWFDRTQGKQVLSSSPLVTALAPCALYLFWGLILVSAYNDIAVASRPNVTFDAAFNRIDSWLLHGMTVSGLAHGAVHSLPAWFYSVVEFVYYFCMFPQVGAAMLLLSFRCGRQETFRLTVALLTAYYLAVGLFWLWPTQGPFFICGSHFADFPSSLRTYSIQQILSEKAASLWAGRGINMVGLDYYIAFPSMHIAIPTIVAIYLRRWTRVFYTLLAIDGLILVTVVLLEWHYVLDVMGALVVAAAVTVLIPPRVQIPRDETCRPGLAVTNSSARPV